MWTMTSTYVSSRYVLDVAAGRRLPTPRIPASFEKYSDTYCEYCETCSKNKIQPGAVDHSKMGGRSWGGAILYNLHKIRIEDCLSPLLSFFSILLRTKAEPTPMRLAGRYNMAMRLNAFRVVESLWPCCAIDVRLTLSCLASSDIIFKASIFDCKAWLPSLRASLFLAPRMWDRCVVQSVGISLQKASLIHTRFVLRSKYLSKVRTRRR